MSSRMWQEIQDQAALVSRLVAFPIDPFCAELRSVRRLILAGTGASLNACRVGQYGFMQYRGLLPHVLPAAELAFVQAEPGTLVILVSQSGQSLETHQACSLLRERGIPFWGMTNNPESALAKQADRVLYLEAGEEVSSATKTYTATVLLLLMLAAGAAGAPDSPQHFAHLAAAVRQTLVIAEPIINAWTQELQSHQVAYLLGLGPLAATAAQGALLLKEKTFLHVEGMSLSEFRHGNIEVVKPGLPLLLLAATPEGAVEAAKHAAYFAGLGASVYLLTDSPVEGLPADRLLVVPHQGDPVTAQIPLVIPLQILAERIAGLKGYEIDGFRYIAKVVDQYKL